MKYKNKKAQIEQLSVLIVALVTVAIILVVGFLIFAEAKDQVVGMITTSTATNESFSYTNTTLTALTHSTGAVSISCITLSNTTDGNVTIGSGNYTCTAAGITVTENYDHSFPSTMWITYSYQAPDYAYNASSTVQEATQDIPGWIPIIIVVVIGALLIGLVSFLRRQAT